MRPVVMNNSELNQNDSCLYLDECKNACNERKCSYCEYNPFNFELISKVGEGQCHDRKSKAFYRFRDNYDPL